MSARDDLFHVIAGVSNDGTRKWCAETRRILDAHRDEVLAENAAERDRLARAVDYALGWSDSATQQLRDGMEDILAAPVAAEETPAPDFFEPGHTYAAGPWEFHCATVTAHPETGDRAALGWTHINGGAWTTYSHEDTEWPAGWTDVTEDGGQ